VFYCFNLFGSRRKRLTRHRSNWSNSGRQILFHLFYIKAPNLKALQGYICRNRPRLPDHAWILQRSRIGRRCPFTIHKSTSTPGSSFFVCKEKKSGKMYRGTMRNLNGVYFVCPSESLRLSKSSNLVCVC
jgi:hypothetical protein